MSNIDIHHTIKAAASLVPAVHSATLAGASVDTSGFRSAELVVSTGAIAGSGLYSVALQESATTIDGDFTDVVAGDTLGDALPASLEASTVYRIGYRGSKRYIRAKITKTSGTSIAASATFILGHPAVAPVA